MSQQPQAMQISSRFSPAIRIVAPVILLFLAYGVSVGPLVHGMATWWQMVVGCCLALWFLFLAQGYARVADVTCSNSYVDIRRWWKQDSIQCYDIVTVSELFGIGTGLGKITFQGTSDRCRTVWFAEFSSSAYIGLAKTASGRLARRCGLAHKRIIAPFGKTIYVQWARSE
jgi:hypothetical protein